MTKLEQLRIGLEYYIDTTHFGKIKGESITTNKIESEPQTEYSRCAINGTPFDECGVCKHFNCDTCQCEAQTKKRLSDEKRIKKTNRRFNRSIKSI